MQIRRKANAHWNGTGKEGNGNLSTESLVLEKTPYSYNTRFGDVKGTNPEELIGAAHAGCFSMKLAFVLQSKNVTPESIDTTATVVLEDGNIHTVELHTRVKATSISAEDFSAAATEAKENCPVGKLLKANVILNAELV